MNLMQCQIESHNGSQIIVACLDRQCKQANKLCCCQCIDDSHNSHLKQCVEINQINNFIKQVNHKQPQSQNYGQKQIIQSLEWFNKLIESLQNIIMQKIQMIESDNLQEFLKKTSSNYQGIEYWDQLLQGILQYVEIDNCIINVNKSKKDKLNLREEQEIKFIQQSGERVQNMIQVINQIQVKIDNPKLYFDENRKNQDFIIFDETIIKKARTSSCTMAFAKEGFDPSSQSYKFAFHIQNIVRNVLLGVGNDNEDIKSIHYVNEKVGEGLGHGQYMINSFSKFTYHHTDEQFQEKENGIEFEARDKIQIKYDHITKMLEFRNQSNHRNILKKNVITMPITDMTRMLYPCVFSYYAGNQVQIEEY